MIIAKTKKEQIAKKVYLSKKQAFTLIELLIVIAIIGILAGVVLVSTNGGRTNARDAVRKQHLAGIRSGLEIYFAQYGVYPSESYCDSSTGSCGAACPCGGSDWNYTTPSYIGLSLRNSAGIQNLPIDPINDDVNYYSYEPDCNQGLCVGRGCCGYTLTARLESPPNFSIRGGY